MNRTRFGGSIVKYLLLLLFLAALVGFFMWKSNYGRTGMVGDVPHSTVDYIAFIRQGANGQTDLYIVRADGSDLKPLTDSRGGKRTPAWTPDGKMLCYAAEPDQGGRIEHTYQLFLRGAGDPVQATYGSIAKDAPQWRPDGKQIAFLTGGMVKVMNPNGTGVEQIYPPPHKGGAPGENGEQGPTEQEGDPLKKPPVILLRWSPNGSAIAALVQTEGDYAQTMGSGDWYKDKKPGEPAEEPQMTVMEPETPIILSGIGEGDPMVLPGANRVGFSWYPDSTHLAVTMSTSRNNHALAVFRTDEKNVPPQPLYGGIGYTVAPENPALSPNGKQIAFEVWRMESAENRELLGIAVLPTDNGHPLLIKSAADITKIPIKIKGRASHPQWSPDGARLLYSQPGAGGRDLWVANADGSNPVNLTKGQGDNFDAVWSPARK